jgi:hypothetical protein
MIAPITIVKNLIPLIYYQYKINNFIIILWPNYIITPWGLAQLQTDPWGFDFAI